MKKIVLREALAHLGLKSISHPLFSRFSWNRIRIALMNIERCESSFIGDFLIINFLYHQHSVYLHPNGRGYLVDPRDEKAPKYKMTIPKDVQLMVKEMYDLYKAPIPINMKSN